MTPSHSSGFTLRAEMRLRTRSTRISAPAPGSDFMPAALQPRQHLARRNPFDVREPDDLRNRERVDVDLADTRGRTRSKSRSNQSMPQFGIDAALNHDLRRTLIDGVLHALEHLIVRHRVAFFVMLGPEERAERAVHVADVGVVDRRVDDVGDDVAADASRMRRACAAAPSSCSVGLLVEAHAFVERQPSADGGAVEQAQRATCNCLRNRPGPRSDRADRDQLAASTRQTRCAPPRRT